MKNLPIQVPKIPPTFSKTLIERFKTLQTQLAKAAATLPKQLDLQRQFYSNIRLEPVTLKVFVPVKKTDNPVPKSKQSVKTPKRTRKQKNTSIDFNIALEAYRELRKGERKNKIADRFNFDPSQFRKNPLLIEAKRLAKEEKNARRAEHRLETVSGIMANNGGKNGYIPKGELGHGKSYYDYDTDDSEDYYD